MSLTTQLSNCQSWGLSPLDGLEEFHLIVTSDTSLEFSEQLSMVGESLSMALRERGLSTESIIYCRFFLSNPKVQADPLRQSSLYSMVSESGVSIIGQPPLNGGEVAIYLYCLKGNSLKKTVLARPESDGYSALRVETGSQSFLWAGGLMAPEEKGSYQQTQTIFAAYTALLELHGFKLNPDTIRTWIFVTDVDNNYGGMVDARREYFERHDLQAATHTIASTGIEADFANDRALVSLDAVATNSLTPNQITFMQAPDNMCPTYLYNVTFERGTRVRYGDRNHMYISGTASIDTSGEVMHIGDVRSQAHRTLDNIHALLTPQAASLTDIAYLIIYLRSGDDYHAVRQVVEDRVAESIPRLYTVAPVCRPTWLVEMEGIAITPAQSLHSRL